MFLQVDYNSETDVKDDYTSRRTSKVTYRSEVALPSPLQKWSRRIENAAKLGKVAIFLNVDGVKFYIKNLYVILSRFKRYNLKLQ